MLMGYGTCLTFPPPNDIEFSGEKEGAPATDAESAATMLGVPSGVGFHNDTGVNTKVSPVKRLHEKPKDDAVEETTNDGDADRLSDETIESC